MLLKGAFSVKIGILGFGSMGKTHAYCIKNLPFFFGDDVDATVVGVCTRNIENAKKATARFGLGFYTDNEDDIIYNDEIDTVDICTPNIYHYQTVKKAILAGKNVYCEKPLTVNYAQAKELSDLAKEKGVVCQMVFNNRFMSPIMRAKELMEESRLGRILSFSVKYLHSSALDTVKNAGWKQDKTVCGGGVLFDLGSHIIDLIYSLCGEFQSISGMSQIAYPTRVGMNGEEWQTNADEAFYMMAILKNGACGTLTASKLTLGVNDDLNIEIVGEKGALRFSLMEPNWLYFYDGTAPDAPIGGLRGYTRIECVGRYPAPGGIFPSPKAARGWLEGHVESMLNFLTQLDRGQSGHPDFMDAAHVQAVMETAYRSAEEGGIRLEVPEV
jgi:predicted dehydrogenase